MKLFDIFRTPTPEQYRERQLAELKREYLDVQLKAELANALSLSYAAGAQARLTAIKRIEDAISSEAKAESAAKAEGARLAAD